MEIRNAFEVPLPADEAWAVLTDIERIAPCMPGAELTEVVGESEFKGKVSVRLGPVALSFNGTARFEEMDAAARRARVRAAGSDAKGRGGAEADVVFSLEPAGDATRVLVQTDLRLSGSVAQYGRGAGMISDLAGQLIGQFADCLRRELAQATAPEAPGAAARPAEPPREAAPIQGLSLGLRVLWRALLRALKGLFGKGGDPQG